MQPDDPQDLALPRLELRRRLLEEIEDVLLRQVERLAALVGAHRRLFRGCGQGAPEIVVDAFLIGMTLGLARGFGLEVARLGPRIAMDPLVHQRVRGIEQALDRGVAIALLAIR